METATCRNVRGAHIKGHSRGGDYEWGETTPFHLREPMRNERPCWQRWRELAGLCERHLTAARIERQQREQEGGRHGRTTG